MSIFSAKELTLLASGAAGDLLTYAQHLDEERDTKQKRVSELGREKLKPGAKVPLEEIYKTLKELKPTTLQLLETKLASVQTRLQAQQFPEAVSEFAALQVFIYDGLKAPLPTDRALLFPPELGPYLCEKLEQHRLLYFEVKKLIEEQTELAPSLLPKLLNVFPLSKLKEMLKVRVESDLRQVTDSPSDIPSVLSLFQTKVESQHTALGFDLLGESALELWQCYDVFLAEKLRPVIDTLNLQGFSAACSAVRLKLKGLQATMSVSQSVTKVNFTRTFLKTSELLETRAMNLMMDLAEMVESEFAIFVAETSRDPPDLKIKLEGQDLDIEAAEAMTEGLDGAVTSIKPQINPGDVSPDSDSESLVYHQSSTRNPDAVFPNPTKLAFPRNPGNTKASIKLSAKEVPHMVTFMKNFQLSVTSRLAFPDLEWEKRNYAVISLDDIAWKEFTLEDGVVKSARVLHGSTFCWPKRVTSPVKHLVEAIDRCALLASSSESLLRTLCSNLTTQINYVLHLYEGNKLQQLYSMHPIRALALDICSLVVLSARQEQLYTLFRMASRQAFAEEVYVLSRLKQQKTQATLLHLLDSKLRYEMSLLLVGIDTEQWQDPKVRYTSKGTDQPSYAVSATHSFLKRTQTTLESILHRELTVVTLSRLVQFWASQVGTKYCSQLKPSRTRLAQYLKDLDVLQKVCLEEFQRLCEFLPGLGEEMEGVAWEVFLALRALWQALHMFFLTAHILKLPCDQLQQLIALLQETSAFQPEMDASDWPLPSVLSSCPLNPGSDLYLHIRDSLELPAHHEEKPPSKANSSYFADLISREFNCAFSLFNKIRSKYSSKYTIFHILLLFCLASGNSMKEQLEKSLPIMFQNRAKSFSSYEELVMHGNNLRDFFIFPVSKFISVVRRRAEMVSDTYPPLSAEDQASRSTIETLLNQLHAVEPGSPSVDESAVPSPT